jgi:hypothetical protein
MRSGGFVLLRLSSSLGEQFVHQAHVVGNGLLEGSLQPRQCRARTLEDKALPFHPYDEGLTGLEVQFMPHLGRNDHPPLGPDMHRRLSLCHSMAIMARQPGRATGATPCPQPEAAARAEPDPPLGTVSRRKNIGTYVRAAAHASIT